MSNTIQLMNNDAEFSDEEEPLNGPARYLSESFGKFYFIYLFSYVFVRQLYVLR